MISPDSRRGTDKYVDKLSYFLWQVFDSLISVGLLYRMQNKVLVIENPQLFKTESFL